MKFPRRRCLQLILATVAASFFSYAAFALDYPTRPVRLIVPVAAGGGADITARLIGQWLSERLGQQFIVENRPGGGTNIGTEAAAHAPADGYTLLLVNLTHAINVTLYEKLNYNFARDIEPVASIIGVSNVIEVHPSVPAKTLPQFIAYAKANPGKINMGSAGNGSSSHMAGELFKMMAGVNLVHVPYRGQGPAMTDLLGGQLQVIFATTPGTTEYVRTGKLRALAVTTRERADALPDVPTVAEFVPGYESSQWYGIGAPKGMPAEIVDKLNREVNAALVDPRMKSRFADVGGAPLPGSPADFAKLIAGEIEKWGRVVKFAGIRAE
ncbi:MAG TPA: tripartite tricarboxylate transporter substrate binding protein [Xanthobacteraceae bacterium]|jgi:tripartite-type tricarboxylate transporter receptor subunit TctC|nr:tripartite tricarboxylate transporter substrate binding protein [Xanthobacteraceae bacterium]